MRTKKELEVLYAKFDKDIATKSRALRVLISIDQFFNTLLWNGSQDETISSHIDRLQEAGKSTWFDDKVCCFLQRFEYNHCKESLGE